MNVTDSAPSAFAELAAALEAGAARATDAPGPRPFLLTLDPYDPTAAATAGEAALTTLRGHVADLHAQDPRVRRDEPGAVADMRVTTRALRSTLTGFRRILAAEVTRPLVDDLRWLGAQLAEEHDSEVLIERLAQQVAGLPGELVVGPVAVDLMRGLGRRVDHGERTVHAALASPRYAALLTGLDRLLLRPPLTHRADRPATAELTRAVARSVRTLDRALDRALAMPSGPERDVALHDARKADKRVRQLAAAAAPVVGKPARRLRHQARKLQDLLGDYQDAVVAQPMLRRLDTEARVAGHDGFTYGVLYMLERERAERALHELPARLEHLHDPRTLAWLGTTAA